jgi:hypothetical protein
MGITRYSMNPYREASCLPAEPKKRRRSKIKTWYYQMLIWWHGPYNKRWAHCKKCGDRIWIKQEGDLVNYEELDHYMDHEMNPGDHYGPLR